MYEASEPRGAVTLYEFRTTCLDSRGIIISGLFLTDSVIFTTVFLFKSLTTGDYDAPNPATAEANLLSHIPFLSTELSQAHACRYIIGVENPLEYRDTFSGSAGV